MIGLALPLMIMTDGRPVNTADPGSFVSTGAGTYSLPVPAGVYEVSALLVGAGGNSANELYINPAKGGDGGDLRWINNLPVTPGETLRLIVGAASGTQGYPGGSSKLQREVPKAGGGTEYVDILVAKGGNGPRLNNNDTSTPLGLRPDGSFVGGGSGGLGGQGASTSYAGGGGGAGGYSGNGGTGGTTGAGTIGSGGAGGPGAASTGAATSGGGVGIYGEGTTGNAATGTGALGGGSGGDGRITCGTGAGTPTGGNYGSGGGAYDISNANYWQMGGPGAGRALWGKGPNNGGRAFPATNVATSTA